MAVFLVLLRFSPGLLKEIAATAAALESRRAPRLVVNQGFRWMEVDCPSTPVYVTPLQGLRLLLHEGWTLRATGERSWVYLYNNHPLNPLVALLGRVSGAYDVVLACHEPHKSLANTSLKFRLRVITAQAVQALTLRLSERAVVFSSNGARRFRDAYRWFKGRLVEGRLIVPDPELRTARPRLYLCMPGRPSGSTGHHRFYRIAQVLAETHGLRLCLLYPGAPPSPHWATPEDLAREGVIADPSRLSDRDILEVFTRSKAVLRMDETSTQSGTIPVAFSCGTPVIVRDAPGLTEFVRDGENGVVVAAEPEAHEVARALARLQADPTRISRATRETYLRVFSPASAVAWLEDAFAIS